MSLYAAGSRVFFNCFPGRLFFDSFFPDRVTRSPAGMNDEALGRNSPPPAGSRYGTPLPARRPIYKEVGKLRVRTVAAFSACFDLA